MPYSVGTELPHHGNVVRPLGPVAATIVVRVFHLVSADLAKVGTGTAMERRCRHLEIPTELQCSVRRPLCPRTLFPSDGPPGTCVPIRGPPRPQATSARFIFLCGPGRFGLGHLRFSYLADSCDLVQPFGTTVRGIAAAALPASCLRAFSRLFQALGSGCDGRMATRETYSVLQSMNVTFVFRLSI